MRNWEGKKTFVCEDKTRSIDWTLKNTYVYDMIVPLLKILKPRSHYEHGSLWMETKGKCETEKQKGCLFVIQCGMPWYSEH